MAKVAPGTELREAVDDVIRSHEGALIVVGDPEKLSFLYSGGIQLDAPFRSQLLYELAKLDGAIIVDEVIKRLAWANVQLMPDPTISSNETGTVDGPFANGERSRRMGRKRGRPGRSHHCVTPRLL